MKANQSLGLFYLSRQNIRRKLFRSLVTIIAVAIVAIILFPTTILGEGVNQSLEQGTARLGADLMVVPPGYNQRLSSALISGEPTSFVMDGSVQPLVAQVEGVDKVSPQIYFATLASG
ncbi:MAG: hypothetical protein ACYCXF_07230 [Thermoleophilia bacterium]